MFLSRASYQSTAIRGIDVRVDSLRKLADFTFNPRTSIVPLAITVAIVPRGPELGPDGLHPGDPITLSLRSVTQFRRIGREKERDSLPGIYRDTCQGLPFAHLAPRDAISSREFDVDSASSSP